MGITYKFSVVKGLQAKREYYIAMLPLSSLSILFRDENDYIAPEFRAQRCINEARIPEIRDYILNNRTNYVFSALSASIDGSFTFTASELDDNIGILEVDMDAVFLINDGQHRKAAIEAALAEAPDLARETISVVFFEDAGLKRSQQMFADLNKHAVKSTMSLSTLYDSRDDLANAVKEVVVKVSFLSKYIDKEKDNLGKNSLKLFTLANFLRANKRILKDDIVTEDDKTFLIKYWGMIFQNIKEWNLLENKQMHKCDLRENYILTLSVTLRAFGRLGRFFYENPQKLDFLKRLSEIDWLRNNQEWIGRVIDLNGKIVNNEDAIIKICSLIKSKLNLELTREEVAKENDVKK
jgi:DNA sulfur modification protein DndB